MSKTILVVEDQADNRQILRDLLGAPITKCEAENGEEALTAATEAAARPDTDGHPAAGHGRLRGHSADQGRPGSKGIPIIVVTSYALSGDETRRAPPAATPMSPSPTARVRCLPRSRNSCLKEPCTIRRAS